MRLQLPSLYIFNSNYVRVSNGFLACNQANIAYVTVALIVHQALPSVTPIAARIQLAKCKSGTLAGRASLLFAGAGSRWLIKWSVAVLVSTLSLEDRGVGPRLMGTLECRG